MRFSDGARPSLRRVGKKWVSVAVGDGLLRAQVLSLRFLVNYGSTGRLLEIFCEDPIAGWNTDGVLDNASTPVATISLLR